MGTKKYEHLFEPDYRRMIGRADMFHIGMIPYGPYGMPVGNGRFGGPVWEESGSVLSMQLNHTDVFMHNDSSANSADESGCLGQLTVDFGETVFDSSTRQRLSLYDGKLIIQGSGVFIEIVVCSEPDIIYINVDDKREKPKEIVIKLNMVREPEVRKNLFCAESVFRIYEKESVLLLSQKFEETCDTGRTENDHYCATAAAVTVRQRKGQVKVNSEKSAEIVLPAVKEQFSILIGGTASMDPYKDIEETVLSDVRDRRLFGEILKAVSGWWEEFWKKSYVYLPDLPEYEKRRTYYMYLANISNHGKFPSKYNGGIWIAEGDRRDWGNWYWNWNQDALYQPLFSANHMELMEPMFRMREECYHRFRAAARQLWGIQSESAIFIGETIGVLGAEILPEEIAEELREYLAGRKELTVTLKRFAERRNHYLVPWNWGLSGGPVSYVTHTMAATQETAEYFWQKYSYTKDQTWLREHAYSFIKGAAELYRNYDGFIQEEDGYFHFNRTNLHEHIWGGRDIIDDLSLARGVFAVAIKASEKLDTDKDLREKWKYCLEHLAPYPLSSEKDTLGYTTYNCSGKMTWGQGKKPAFRVRALEGTESPQFKMLEKFDVLNMETRDQKLDSGQWKIAVNTFYDTPGYRNQFEKKLEDKNGSSRFLEDAAKLGRAEELEVMFASQYKAFHDTPNGLHDQGDYYSAEGYGTWSAAIQQALHQSIAPLPGEKPVIHVFPAWPRKWNAKYRLLAKDGFLVSSSLTDGEIEYVEIDSQLGERCDIRNPWNCYVDLYRNGKKAENFKAKENELISFDTVAGENIVMVKEGDDPEHYYSAEIKL